MRIIQICSVSLALIASQGFAQPATWIFQQGDEFPSVNCYSHDSETSALEYDGSASTHEQCCRKFGSDVAYDPETGHEIVCPPSKSDD